MGTGWNLNVVECFIHVIITDWDMGTGWNDTSYKPGDVQDYNRLGYGYWLELEIGAIKLGKHYNRLGYGYWLEHSRGNCTSTCNYNRLGYGYWLEPPYH